MSEKYSPRMNHDTAEYWRGVSEKTLLLAHCKDCEHWIHPPRACCPACWSDNIDYRPPTGRGMLYSFTVQANGPGGQPLITGWVELEEQQRLLVVAPLVDLTPETVKIGMQLHLDWLPFQNTFVPTFRQENAL